MTLDEMIQECASYTDNSEDIGVAPYSGDALTMANKYVSAINYAYKKIAKERFRLDYSEGIVLDANLEFSLSSLTKTFYKMVSVENSDEKEISWGLRPGNKVRCPNETAADTVTVFYYYIPADLVITTLTGTMLFPGEAVDPKIPCYYAAYLYFKIDDDERSEIWLPLWNDGYDSIRQNRGETEVTEDVYGVYET